MTSMPPSSMVVEARSRSPGPDQRAPFRDVGAATRSRTVATSRIAARAIAAAAAAATDLILRANSLLRSSASGEITLSLSLSLALVARNPAGALASLLTHYFLLARALPRARSTRTIDHPPTTDIDTRNGERNAAPSRIEYTIAVRGSRKNATRTRATHEYDARVPLLLAGTRSANNDDEVAVAVAAVAAPLRQYEAIPRVARVAVIPCRTKIRASRTPRQ